MAEALRVGNCSGFYGDRLTAMREMLAGGRLDVLTGDYLAELTMLILGRDRMKDASLGYARTFLRQAEDCLGLALEKGVRIVANAGGLNPAGLADRLREVATGLGLGARIAYVDGDDLLDRVERLGLPGSPLTANAYLGGFGIAAALSAGADVVVTGRVTDASLVVGAAVSHFGWARDDWDRLAGAVVAGHVLECGCQATGGNFSGFTRLKPDHRPLGFPLAEVHADGSSVVTKHDDTGGTVSVDTVTAQLLYEVQGPLYLGPDVTTDLSSVRLEQVGDDRVAVTGVRGEPPPQQLKVCVNELGGFRNQVEFVLTGLDIEAKADLLTAQLGSAVDALGVADCTWSMSPERPLDAPTQEGASCLLRAVVRDPSPEKVGRPFSSAAVELALASYPGFTMTAPPGPASPYGVYLPSYVDRSAAPETAHLPDGTVHLVADPSQMVEEPRRVVAEVTGRPVPGPTRRVPLGTVAQARSGDKGGDANIGLWVSPTTDRADLAEEWLAWFVTPDRIRELLPETASLEIDVHPMPNLNGLNVVVHGLLGEGVAASTRFDPQAKALGEWVRSRLVDLPEELL